MAMLPPRLPRSGKAVDPSVLTFNEPLSWTPGNTISEGEIIRRLQALRAELSTMPQSGLLRETLRPIAAELINERLLKHRSKSVKTWTICCIVEVIRHSAPNAVFTGRQLKNIFTAITNYIIPALADSNATYHSENLTIVKSLHDVQSILLVADVPSGTVLTRALVSACFDTLSVNPSELPISVCHNLTSLLSTLVNEADNLPDDVIDIILAQFLRADPRSRFSKGKKQPDPVDAKQATLLLKEVPPAYTMAQDICLACVNRMARYVLRYFSSILADTALALSERAPKKSGLPADDDQDTGPRAPSEEELAEWEKAHLLLRELWRAAHGVLQEIIPQMEIELVTDNLHIRQMAVEALGGMIAGIGAAGPPLPPTLDPAAHPSQSVVEPEARPYHFLLTPSSAISFISRYPATYEAFLGRRRDKSPIIRAAFSTAIGRIILFDVGGRGFSSEKQRAELLGYFAESIGDLDDKVRLSALKVLEEYPFSDVLSKLGDHGPITQPGSILFRVADRVKDRKLAVSLAAVPLLAKWWGVAVGAIAAGDKRVKDLLGSIPDILFAGYFVQERDIHHAVEKAIHDSLLPLTFPPRIRPADTEAHNLQAPSGSGESEPEANRLRAERILLLVDSLSPKTRGAYFAKQTLQPTFAKYVGFYLTLCEDYNGGVTNSGRAISGKNVKSPSKAIAKSSSGKDAKSQPGKDPKSQLVLLIETALLGHFPDRLRAKDDLMKFAKHHDRRCYALIRFTSAPQSDWTRVRKSTREICKRLEDSQPSVLNTITYMLARSSLLVYNRSNLPGFFHFARSNEKGLSEAAHAIIKEISQVQAQVFSTLLKQQCETLMADKPSVDKPHSPGSVEDLKACSRFSVNYPQKIPEDRKFFGALMAFVNHGTPRAAKYAACILLTASPKKAVYAGYIYSSCAEEFDIGDSGYLSKLAGLSQVMRYSPEDLEPEQVDKIVDIAINRVLLRKRDAAAAAPEFSDEDWTNEPDEDVQGKFWALKILVNRLLTLPETDDVSTVAETVFSFLNTVIATKGQMDGSPVSPAHASRLRRAAVTNVLKLCRQPRYNRALQPVMFHKLCLTAHDPVFEVREVFLKKIVKHIAKDKLPKRFHTPLYLYAFEPHVPTKTMVGNWLKSRAQSMAKTKYGSLEMVLVRLISLLAHHPDFFTDTPKETRMTYSEMIQYLVFFLQTIVNIENVSLIYFIAQRVKYVSDGIDPTSTNIYALSDLAQAIIRKLQEQHHWALLTCSEKLDFPWGIFEKMSSSAKASQVASKVFLPPEIVENLDEMIEEGLSVLNPKPKRRARRLKGATPGTKRARRGSDTTGPKPPAKRARGSKTGNGKGKGKAKATSDDEVDIEMADLSSSPLSERRRSRRTRLAKSYKESQDEDGQDEEEEGQDEQENEEDDDEDDELVELSPEQAKVLPQFSSSSRGGARAGASSSMAGSDSDMDMD